VKYDLKGALKYRDRKFGPFPPPHTVRSFRIRRWTYKFLAEKRLSMTQKWSYITHETTLKKIKTFFRKKFFDEKYLRGPFLIGQASHNQLEMPFSCSKTILFCSEMIVYNSVNHIWEGKAFLKTNIFWKNMSGQSRPIFFRESFFWKIVWPLHHSTQFNALIPNMTLIFLQSVTRAPTIEFPTRNLGFLDIL